jgi:preprotein translocase subunit YajC
MFSLLIADAHAQAAPAQQNPIMSMLPLIMVFMVFYFLMLRPQKKKAQADRDYVQGLQKGEEVYTKSGIIGTIYGITEKVITLELDGGVKMKILKSHIGGSAKDIFATKPEKK